MARSLSTTVTEAYNDMRLDSFLYESGLYESRSKAVKQIEAGKVFVGGQTPTKKNSKATTEYFLNPRIFHLMCFSKMTIWPSSTNKLV